MNFGFHFQFRNPSEAEAVCLAQDFKFLGKELRLRQLQGVETVPVSKFSSVVVVCNLPARFYKVLYKQVFPLHLNWVNFLKT